MNAIFFQSCQFFSATECISSSGGNTKGINLRPFTKARPELNGLAANHLHHPPRPHAHTEALLTSNRGQSTNVKVLLTWRCWWLARPTISHLSRFQGESSDHELLLMTTQCCCGSKTNLSAQYLWGLGHHLYPQTVPRILSPLPHVTHGLGTKRSQCHNSLKTLETMSLDKIYTSQTTQCSSTSLSQSSPPSWFSCPFLLIILLPIPQFLSSLRKIKCLTLAISGFSDTEIS